jgi:hypothetical protein
LIGVVCLILLFSAWALVTFFPAEGLVSVERTLVRGAAATLGCLCLALTLSWPLKALGLIAWSPLRDHYRIWRELRTRRRIQSELARGERRRAPYRAIEALPRTPERA